MEEIKYDNLGNKYVIKNGKKYRTKEGHPYDLRYNKWLRDQTK